MTFQIRSASHIKLRSLHKVINDLRRVYAGSIPLSRQEKLSTMIIEMNEEKRKTNAMLKEAEEKALEAETRAKEMLVKQEGESRRKY